MGASKMSISVSFHNCTKAEAQELPGVPNDSLQFTDSNGNRVLLYIPSSVAQATAAAFNEAMREHKRNEEMSRVEAAE